MPLRQTGRGFGRVQEVAIKRAFNDGTDSINAWCLRDTFKILIKIACGYFFSRFLFSIFVL